MIVTDIWKNFGYGAIVYLAAILGIDTQLYEAAQIDGAKSLAADMACYTSRYEDDHRADDGT